MFHHAQLISSLKALLDVRAKTGIDMVLVELGMMDSLAYVRDIQRNFWNKIRKRSDYNDSVLKQVIDMAIRVNSPMSVVFQNMLSTNQTAESQAASRILASSSSRALTYREINPHLSVHEMYTCQFRGKESDRIVTSRLRLQSHRLKVETGR